MVFHSGSWHPITKGFTLSTQKKGLKLDTITKKL